MKIFKNRSLLFLLAAIVLGGSACSSKEDDLDLNLEAATMTVIGDVQGSFSGMADFDVLKTSQIENWSISMHDYSPQTFSLSIMRLNQGLENPEVGTYTIGMATIADFSASFTHIENGDFSTAREYITLGDDPTGTLTIQSANDQTIKGSFDFTATEYDDALQPLNSVQIKGTFTANKRK